MKSLQSRFKYLRIKMRHLDKMLSKLFNDDRIIFFDSYLVEVDFNSNEAGFIRLVSFLYIILFEGTSKINYELIKGRNDRTLRDNALPFKELIHVLRTVLQHNLNLSKDYDKKKKYFFDEWIESVTGKTVKLSSKDWKQCCHDLMNQFEFELDLIENEINHISLLDDDIRKLILEDWENKLKINYPIYKYKLEALTIAKNWGLETLDVDKFCNKYYNIWLKELLTHSDYTFENISKRQIERELLNSIEKNELPIPISGDDLMRIGVPKGHQIKEFYKRAQQIYTSNPCTKDELLSIIIDLLNTK